MDVDVKIAIQSSIKKDKDFILRFINNLKSATYRV